MLIRRILFFMAFLLLLVAPISRAPGASADPAATASSAAATDSAPPSARAAPSDSTAASDSAAPPDRSRERPPLELNLTSGRFRPLEPPAQDPPWYSGRAEHTSPRGRRYLVAITGGPLDAEQRFRLEREGARLLGYLPVNGYRVRVSPQREEKIRALPFVAWLGELPPHTKVRADLEAKASHRDQSASRRDQPVRIRVVLWASEPEFRVRAALSGLETVAAPSGKDGAWRLEAIVPAARLGPVISRLSDLPEVEAIEAARRLSYHNQDAVWVHQSFVGPSPQETPIFDAGIFGCGQVIAVSDSGQDFDACYFRDAVLGDPPISSCVSPPCAAATPDPNQRKDIIYYNWSGTALGDDDLCPGLFGASGHGTHTSGSVAGDDSPYADCAGFGTPARDAGDGQAPGAKLVIQEMGDGLEYLGALGGSVWNLLDVAYRSGARIHSLSWGGVCHDLLGICDPDCTLPYDSFARDADLAMWTYPDFLLVASVANARGICAPPNAVSTPAIAKNLISAGSVGHGAAATTPSTFTSPGPVFDGRLKPTLAAQGEAVDSAASDASPITDNCGVCALDGTSMSAPTIAGLAALVREYYTEGFHAAGVRSPSQGLVPSGALVKATVIDGAVTPGTGGTAPDFLSGYGRILLGQSLAFSGSAFQLRARDHRDGITTGSVVNHAFDVSGGTQLRATLVWTDPPADLSAAPARVNELKLEAIDPGGNTWFQTLDPGAGLPAPTADPNDPHDSVNVEERLVFDAPAPGRWVFRVKGESVPIGPQPFALVVRGALSDCPAPAAPAAVTASVLGPNQVEIAWDAVSGAAAYNVYRSFGACPGGPWIPLAAGIAETSHLDTTVSGGITYSYHVTAASDADGYCESPSSPCGQVIATGECVLGPTFGGITAASDAGQGTCTVDLSWAPATPLCGGDVRYNVYRDTTSGFTPGPTNRIARCVVGTTYADAADLGEGVTYYYVVRAEDDTAGHGGPCRGGNEEANLVEAAAAPSGPPVPAVFFDDAGDTQPVQFATGGSWVIDPTGGDSGPKVYSGVSGSGVCADLTGPDLLLGAPGTNPQLSFSTIHDLEYDPYGLFGAEGSLGQVEIATGPAFDDWDRLSLTPDYPAVVEFPLNLCSTTDDWATYFSGTDLVYDTYTASLTPWEGTHVRIRFHLSGDLLYTGGYWSVDDIQVDEIQVPGTCATAAAGPPPVPDGASVPGSPLEVSLSGSDVHLTWDATTCPAAAVNVYWGSLGDFSTFTGGACDLASTGSATVAVPDDVWILVVATDGADTDGSWSRDAAGNELTYAGASTICPAITKHLTNNGCP